MFPVVPASQRKVIAAAETINHPKVIHRMLIVSFTRCGLQASYKHTSKTLSQAKWHLTGSYISSPVCYLNLSYLRVFTVCCILCDSPPSLHKGAERLLPCDGNYCLCTWLL